MFNILYIPASLGAMLIYGGIHRGFGILFVEFRKSFNSSSASMSLVVSVQIAVMSLASKFRALIFNSFSDNLIMNKACILNHPGDYT